MKWLKNVLLLLLIVCALCLEQIVTACADSFDPYDDYVSFFHSNTAGSSAYMPFYYASGIPYYNDWGGPYRNEKQEDGNIREWLAFSGNKLQEKDAAAFIYKFSYSDLSNLYYHIEKGKPLQLADSVQRNGMTQWFLKDKDLEALGYLMFAKKCEVNAAAGSQWDTPSRDANAMQNSIKGGLQLWKAAKKDFFKWRYAYQVIRMAFYSNDYQRTQDLHKELIGSQTADNIMYFRCLSLKAGAYYKTGDYNTAAYLYAQAFYGTDDEKLSNYISYNWCFRPHGEDYQNGPHASRAAVLGMTKNNHEKALISLMDALHEYESGITLMNQAYALQPDIKGLDVVMTREINKLEDRYLSPALNRNRGFNNYNPYTHTSYEYSASRLEEIKKADVQNKKTMQDLIAFGTKVYNDRKTSDPAFWPLAVAYLYFIQQDWQSSEAWIAKAEELNPNDKIKEMLHMEKLLLAISKNKKLDAAVESSILPSLQWLETKATQHERYAITYRNLLTSVLPNVYMKQQDTLKALLCIAKGTIGADGKGGYYSWYPEEERKQLFIEPGYSDEMEQVSTDKIIALKSWIGTDRKSPYETWLVKYKPYQAGALDLYIGTRYLRQHDFASAVKVMKDIPSSLMLNNGLLDPFAERWEDTQEPRDTTPVTDKYKFARDMQELQAGLPKANAQQLYRYANGLYSMTYYGLSWSTVLYYRSGSDGIAYYDDPERKELLPEYRNYYTAEEAMKYYQLAFEKSKDPELRAKCLFMLSKCWQKSSKVQRKYYYDPQSNEEYVAYTLNSPYFKQLAENYAETAIFKSLSEDCSYLRYFIRKTNKR
jgi:hypothetical protein